MHYIKVYYVYNISLKTKKKFISNFSDYYIKLN